MEDVWERRGGVGLADATPITSKDILETVWHWIKFDFQTNGEDL